MCGHTQWQTSFAVCTFRSYNSFMECEWDDAKRKENLQKHGLDFADAPELFKGPALTSLDTRERYGEDRWIGIGLIKGRCVVICYTERKQGKTVRVISLRKALSHERKPFEKRIADQLGKGG